MIRNVKLEDIKELAPIYKDLYDDADIGEFWTVENAEKLLGYFYDRQKYIGSSRIYTDVLFAVFI